ncbi:MAG TPA: serine/threonine-protein kinase [Phycisphaerales bacterium]|nr:serine/threonine-protein kinase [Phycisphaerales bacterium]
MIAALRKHPDPERVAALLEEAIALSDPERDAYLAQRCAGDEALRREVASLLAAHSLAPHCLEAPDGLEASGDSGIIGPYRLVQRIGEGGFGVVYLARQAHPVRRDVALKIIKLGMDTRQVIARFEAERQALAMMDHPGIARVFEAGATESGRPYFAMELVRGEPITQYCERQGLGVRARLALFRQVCLAVQHAHQKGIIHRDIKPSNVLVVGTDAGPAPKVIDFGIAKATNSELTEKTLLTERHQLVGTPEYMSPEQAEGSGEDIDTRSDIYSLGVLLYELLTGSTPFDGERLRSASWAELRRIIREEEPPRPSGRTGAGMGRSGRTGAPASSRSLRRELDWIVLKAMAKDRSRRYGSAGELAADLERFLTNRPVLASSPGTLYRVCKFARRHRAGLAAAGALGAGAAVALVALSVAVVQVSRERVAAVLAGDRAAAARDESDAVTEFLEAMLAAVDPGRSGRDVTVREVLDDAALRIEGGVAGAPLVEARLRRTIGDTYRALGLYTEAEHHLRRAHALLSIELGGSDPLALRTQVRVGEVLERLGRFEEAAQLLTGAAEATAAALGEESAEHLAAVSGLANVRARLGEHDAAGALYEHVYRAQRKVHGPAHSETLRTQALLAAAHRQAGRYAEAEATYLDVVPGLGRAEGAEAAATLAAMGDLAGLYLELSRWEEAAPLCERVLDARSRVLGPEHPDTLVALDDLAELRRHQGRHEEAEALSAQALGASRRVLGEQHPSTIQRLNDHAVMLQSRAKYAEAEPLLRQAVESQRGALGPEHPHTLTSMNNLASALGAQGKHAEAERLHRGVLDARRRVLGPDHFDTLISMNTLAQLHVRAGEFETADPLLEDALARSRRTLGDAHAFTGMVLLTRGLCLRELGRLAEAEPLLLEARGVFEHAYPPGHSYARHAADQLSRLYAQLGREEESLRWGAIAKAPAEAAGAE